MKYKVLSRSTNIYYNILGYVWILLIFYSIIVYIMDHEFHVILNIFLIIAGFIILIDAIWDVAIITLDDKIVIKHGFWLFKQKSIKPEEITCILPANSSIKSFLKPPGFSRYQTIQKKCIAYPGSTNDTSLIIILKDGAIALSCKGPCAVAEILIKKYDIKAENIMIPTWFTKAAKHD